MNNTQTKSVSIFILVCACISNAWGQNNRPDTPVAEVNNEKVINKTEKVRFMDHLSVSLEAGGTGFGFEVATTLHPKFALRTGFTMFIFSKTEEGHINSYNNDYDDFNDFIKDMPEVQKILKEKGLPTSIGQADKYVPLKNELRYYNGKILVDYYPIEKRRFRVTAGLYFGNSSFLRISGQYPYELLQSIRILNQYLPTDKRLRPIVENVDGIFCNEKMGPGPSGKVECTYKINPVKPYIGIGGGRSVPNKRIGINFDIGLLMEGKRTLTSPYYAENGFRELRLLCWRFMPTASLRLTGRIF